MNEISFLENVRECKKILEDWGLLLKVCGNNIINASSSKYSKEFISLSRQNEYFSMYKCAIENDDYDFLLIDNSFIQFSYDYSEDKKCEVIRMAYYPSVDEYTYASFLSEELDEDINICGAEYFELFQQFISEQNPVKKTVLRYDYDKSLYVKSVHSAAHLHFGDEENIRIPINAQLKPSAFIKFVLEYFYFNNWKKMINNKDEDIWITSHDTDFLDAKVFVEEDRLLPYICIMNRKK